MSADVLRKAAALMRKRADGLNPEHGGAPEGWYAHLASDGRAWVAGPEGKWLSAHGFPFTAEHIASWHPAVASAVADWLDAQADDLSTVEADVGWVTKEWAAANERALAVARAYLGDTP